MTRSLKTLFLILALAALPLRGVASVAIWHCAQEQHDTVSASVAALADSPAGHHEAHDGAAAHAGHHPPTSADGDTEPSSLSDSPPASTCSACAACCMGGSIAPVGFHPVAVAPNGAGRIAFFEPHVTGVVPAQLERPPLVRLL